MKHEERKDGKEEKASFIDYACFLMHASPLLPESMEKKVTRRRDDAKSRKERRRMHEEACIIN